MRRQQGRAAEAERLCRVAIAEAQVADDELLLARASFNLDWALVDLGRGREATHSAKALEIYTRAGDIERQAAVLNNLGMFAYYEGRWQDAVDLYARAAEASARAGDVWAAAYGDCNIGEVLADQGRLDEAEERLRRARRVWHGTEDEHGVAFTSALLGRLAARAGRHDDAAELLSGAARSFHELQTPGDAALAEAYLAEAALLAGRGRARRWPRPTASSQQGAAARALLLRVRGGALGQLGDDEAAAAAALEDALAEARARDERYEVALALDALLDIGRGAERSARSATRWSPALGVAALPTAVTPVVKDPETGLTARRYG